MISDEDSDPKTKRAKPRLLDNMSVPDLQDYLAQLKAEQERVEAEIRKKEKHRDAVESFFKGAS